MKWTKFVLSAWFVLLLHCSANDPVPPHCSQRGTAATAVVVVTAVPTTATIVAVATATVASAVGTVQQRGGVL